MKADKQHIADENSFQHAFNDWDAGLPSYEVWDDLEAELSTSALWENIHEKLTEDHNTTDNSLFDSYEKWSPNAAFNGWTKLDEELSRERVWHRIGKSLTQIAAESTVSYFKIAASLLLFSFLSFYVNFEGSLRKQIHFNKINGSQLVVQNDVQNPVDTKSTAQQVINQQVVPQNESQITDNPSLISTESSWLTDNTLDQNQANNADLKLEEINKLAPRDAVLEFDKSVSDFVFIPLTTNIIKPHFSIAFGGQFGLMNEKNLRQYSSFTPNMGIAANFQYHSYWKNIRFTQDVGFSQYVQNKGNYNNGRFVTSTQKLNTISLSSSVGYTHKNFTAFAGISVNRLLNGYEENKNYISNVYTTKKMQVGGILGMDYHFAPFKNKTAMGIGLQYQLVSQMKGENTTFNNLQGLKLQLKFSF